MRFSFIIVFFILSAQVSLLSLSRLVPFVEGKKVGYMDSLGIVQIPAQYYTPISRIHLVFERDSFPTFKLPNWAYFSEGKATVRIARKFWFFVYKYEYAVIDYDNEFVFSPSADIVHSFTNDLAPYQFLLKTEEHRYGEKFGIINSKAEWLLEPIYDYVANFSDGIALLRKGTSYFYVDKNGKRISDNEYTDAQSFSEGLAAVRIGDKYGYINTSGKLVIEPQFDYARSFSNGLARIYDGKYFRYIDKEGKLLNTQNFEVAYDFSDGLACVKEENGSYGFINTKGEYQIKPQYYYAKSFSDGLAAVSDGNKFGFINLNDETIIELKYDFADFFQNGVGKVWLNKEMFFINRNGEIIYTYDFKR